MSDPNILKFNANHQLIIKNTQISKCCCLPHTLGPCDINGEAPSCIILNLNIADELHDSCNGGPFSLQLLDTVPTGSFILPFLFKTGGLYYYGITIENVQHSFKQCWDDTIITCNGIILIEIIFGCGSINPPADEEIERGQFGIEIGNSTQIALRIFWLGDECGSTFAYPNLLCTDFDNVIGHTSRSNASLLLENETYLTEPLTPNNCGIDMAQYLVSWNRIESCPPFNNLGPCCSPEGNCTTKTFEDCSNSGGNFKGAGIECADIECPSLEDALGSCCVDGVCSDVTQSQCLAVGGDFSAISCINRVCPVFGDGACCRVEGEITHCIPGSSAEQCNQLGGEWTWMGPGTTCGDCSTQPPELLMAGDFF